jgi:hypothetical protein
MPGALERAGNRRDSNTALGHICGEALLLRRQLRTPPPFTPTRPCSGQACHDTLPDQRPLMLRHGRNELEGKAPVGRGGIKLHASRALAVPVRRRRSF